MSLPYIDCNSKKHCKEDDRKLLKKNPFTYLNLIKTHYNNGLNSMNSMNMNLGMIKDKNLENLHNSYGNMIKSEENEQIKKENGYYGSKYQKEKDYNFEDMNQDSKIIKVDDLDIKIKYLSTIDEDSRMGRPNKILMELPIPSINVNDNQNLADILFQVQNMFYKVMTNIIDQILKQANINISVKEILSSIDSVKHLSKPSDKEKAIEQLTIALNNVSYKQGSNSLFGVKTGSNDQKTINTSSSLSGKSANMNSQLNKHNNNQTINQNMQGIQNVQTNGINQNLSGNQPMNNSLDQLTSSINQVNNLVSKNLSNINNINNNLSHFSPNNINNSNNMNTNSMNNNNFNSGQSHSNMYSQIMSQLNNLNSGNLSNQQAAQQIYLLNALLQIQGNAGNQQCTPNDSTNYIPNNQNYGNNANTSNMYQNNYQNMNNMNNMNNLNNMNNMNMGGGSGNNSTYSYPNQNPNNPNNNNNQNINMNDNNYMNYNQNMNGSNMNMNALNKMNNNNMDFNAYILSQMNSNNQTPNIMNNDGRNVVLNNNNYVKVSNQSTNMKEMK